MNEQEFSQKVMVFSSKFYGYSYKVIGNREEARDSVQDLYVKLWSLRHTLNDINCIEAYATTMLRNLCLDRLKRIKNKSIHFESLAWISSDPDDSGNENIINDTEIKLDLVRWALKRLPQLQQKIFLMRDFEEREYTDISKELGITQENVRVMLSRARKRIRELIGKSGL